MAGPAGGGMNGIGMNGGGGGGGAGDIANSGTEEGTGVRLDRLGVVQLPIFDKFFDTKDINRLTPGWVPLNTNLRATRRGASSRRSFSYRKGGAEIRFEVYLATNLLPKGRQRVPKMLRLRLPGVGVSVINSDRKREELYLRLSGVDVAVQVVSS